MATAVAHDLPLIVVVGPTASGKTALAIRIAQEYNGEVISADSRAIYEGLSIGTAKPSIEERVGVPHWAIDLVKPNQRFTAADFKQYTIAKISEIRSRGHLPILAGGTGLYIDAVMYDFDFSGAAVDEKRREKLQTLSLEELHDYCIKHNIMLPENKQNKRHVISAILRERKILKRKYIPEGNTIVVGIATEKNTLQMRIIARATTILDAGVIDEAVTAANKYGWECEAMTGNIYPLIRQYVNGDLSRSELKEKFIIKDRQLAKRQMTWFKRSEHIYWADPETAHTYIARKLDALNNSWYYTSIKRKG